jgi:cation transport ATPase
MNWEIYHNNKGASILTKAKKRSNKREKNTNKFTKDTLVNKLLFVVIFSIISFIALKLIYIGYVHVNYVLGMPKAMIIISIIGFVLAGLAGFMCFVKENKAAGYMNFFNISLACAISCISIYFYSLYAIRALWCVIGIYMILSFIYYIFMFNKEKNKNSVSK